MKNFAKRRASAKYRILRFKQSALDRDLEAVTVEDINFFAKVLLSILVELNPLTSKQILPHKSKREPTRVSTRNDRDWPLLPVAIPVQWYRYLCTSQRPPAPHYSVHDRNLQPQATLPAPSLPALPRPHRKVDKRPLSPSTFLNQCHECRTMAGRRGSTCALRRVGCATGMSLWRRRKGSA